MSPKPERKLRCLHARPHVRSTRTRPTQGRGCRAELPPPALLFPGQATHGNTNERSSLPHKTEERGKARSAEHSQQASPKEDPISFIRGLSAEDMKNFLVDEEVLAANESMVTPGERIDWFPRSPPASLLTPLLVIPTENLAQSFSATRSKSPLLELHLRSGKQHLHHNILCFGCYTPHSNSDVDFQPSAAPFLYTSPQHTKNKFGLPLGM